MEHSLGISTGVGGNSTAKVVVSEKNVRVEKEYMALAKEDGLELGLGLSLGGGGGGGGFEYGRILTAKDFPNGLKYGRNGSGTKRERTSLSSPHQGSSAAAAVSNQVVGWPPIRAYRMNSLFNQAKASNGVEEDKGVSDNENNNNSKKKINHGQDKNAEPPIKERSSHLGYVKVNMDGLPIGRKVDLSAHKSYKTLAKTLEDMFFKPSLIIGGGKDEPVQPSKLLNGSSEFVLTYEDKEGDWMLLGDVPWGMFLDTVKRVRIMRTSEANGLTPKFQEIKSSEKAKGKPA